MNFLTTVSLRLGFFTFLLTANFSTLAENENGALALHAVIANKGLGCELTLPESVLQFKPLHSSQLMGALGTYQIKPLRVKLACVDESEAILPILTLEGDTPYAQDIQQTVFLNGTPNGVGFMVRQSSDDKPIALVDFYQPDAAIGRGGNGKPLSLLNEANLYQNETLLWVGLVGPLQPEIIPGHFYASLTLNVAFQ